MINLNYQDKLMKSRLKKLKICFHQYSFYQYANNKTSLVFMSLVSWKKKKKKQLKEALFRGSH